MKNFNITKEQIINLFLNLVGSSMLAFAVCAFVAPFDLIVGGATGIALITHKLLGVSVSMVAFIINMGVLIPGWIWGGKKLVFGSVLSSLIYPVALAVFERIPAITTIADNTLLAAICGAAVAGAGIGLVMKSGGSTGGLDIPVLLIHKYFHLPVNSVMNATDICIMIFQIPFSSLTNVIYGIIYTIMMTTAINKVLTLGAERVKLTIVSEAYEQIAHQLTLADFGFTLVQAEGGYTHTPIRRIECVMISDQLRRAQRIVENIDPTAFVTTENVKDVRGRGYTLERIWLEF